MFSASVLVSNILSYHKYTEFQNRDRIINYTIEPEVASQKPKI